MGLADRYKKAPTLRAFLNVGCLFDIPTGEYRRGKHDESILNGGLSPITGIGGRGNTYKSTLAHFFFLRSLDRYLSADGVVYDTEESLTTERLFHLCSWMPHIGGVDIEAENRMILTNKSTVTGNKWFESFRDYMAERRKNPKDDLGTTPFIDKDGQHIKVLKPHLAEVDSFSAMETEAHEKMFEKAEVGESDLNMEAMKGAAAKSQLMMQLPGVTGGGGGYILLTAHVGDEHQLDPYAPPSKKLTFLKGKVKFKRVPENFTFLTNNCWYCLSATVLINQSTKAPEFPRNKDDDYKGDTDLMLVTLQNLRAKSGPTGLPMEVIASQRDGVHVGLTEFYYIKKHDRFGLGGHDRNYFLELCPDIALQRTTVRNKIDTEPTLQRALEITSELCQMKNLWHHLPQGLLPTPKELYEGLKAKGYDWAKLLDTRAYWMFEEDVTESTKPFLSTMDLVRMLNGDESRFGKAYSAYHPWWYPKEK